MEGVWREVEASCVYVTEWFQSAATCWCCWLPRLRVYARGHSHMCASLIPGYSKCGARVREPLWIYIHTLRGYRVFKKPVGLMAISYPRFIDSRGGRIRRGEGQGVRGGERRWNKVWNAPTTFPTSPKMFLQTFAGQLPAIWFLQIVRVTKNRTACCF